MYKERRTLEEFIKISNIIHNNKYTYNFSIYTNCKEQIIITCPIHGNFSQLADNHIRGHGCKKCENGTVENVDDFIFKARKVHGDKFDYHLVEYINCKLPVKIICPDHGIFEQTPDSHIRTRFSCVACSNKNSGDIKRSSKEEFIEKAQLIHGDKFDYSLVKYINSNIKVEIICPKHGVFAQRPHKHLSGHGCRKCGCSKGEQKIINYLNSKNIKYEPQYVFDDCKYINKLRFDFGVLNQDGKLLFLIEYQGRQHYKSVNFGGMPKENA